MHALQVVHGMEDGWREAFSRSSSLLRREGFTVSRKRTGSRNGSARPPDILATHGARVVQAFVLVDADIDSGETRRRIAAAVRRGETRVFVRWPLRWRMLSNVDRWGLRGVSVATW